MKPEEKHIIWSNYDLDYDDWKDDLEADYPDLSEQERIALMYEINGDYLDETYDVKSGSRNKIYFGVAFNFGDKSPDKFRAE